MSDRATRRVLRCLFVVMVVQARVIQRINVIRQIGIKWSDGKRGAGGESIHSKSVKR